MRNNDQHNFNKLVLSIFSAAIVSYTLADLFLNLFETSEDFSKVTSSFFQMKNYFSLIFSVILYLIMMMPLFSRRFEVNIIYIIHILFKWKRNLKARKDFPLASAGCEKISNFWTFLGKFQDLRKIGNLYTEMKFYTRPETFRSNFFSPVSLFSYNSAELEQSVIFN